MRRFSPLGGWFDDLMSYHYVPHWTCHKLGFHLQTHPAINGVYTSRSTQFCIRSEMAMEGTPGFRGTQFSDRREKKSRLSNSSIFFGRGGRVSEICIDLPWSSSCWSDFTGFRTEEVTLVSTTATWCWWTTKDLQFFIFFPGLQIYSNWKTIPNNG